MHCDGHGAPLKCNFSALCFWEFGFFFIYLSKVAMTFNKVECLFSALHEISDDRVQPNLIEHQLFCSCISVVETLTVFSLLKMILAVLLNIFFKSKEVSWFLFYH